MLKRMCIPIQETGIGKTYDKKMRIDSITIFRFIAALIVINFHFGKTLLDWPRILIAGSEMVTFFFVLSGFVMSYSYLPRKNIIPTEFWISRFKRLSPAYYVALILSSVLLPQDNDIRSFCVKRSISAILDSSICSQAQWASLVRFGRNIFLFNVSCNCVGY